MFLLSKNVILLRIGLWPTYNETSYPQYCNGSEKFDMNTIKNLTNILNSYWGSCDEVNENFWAHEWEKHGTCSPYQEYDFFHTVWRVYQKYLSFFTQNCIPEKGVFPVNCFFDMTKDFQIRNFYLL